MNKMKMKKLSLVFLLLSCATVGIKASEGKILIVEMQNGDKTTFSLTEKPEMSFSNHVLFIDINGRDTRFEINQVKQFYFEDASSQAGISAQFNSSVDDHPVTTAEYST